jgi:putative endopeptidase
MRVFSQFTTSLVGGLLAVGCASTPKEAPVEPVVPAKAAATTPAAPTLKSGIETQWFDASVRAQDDFFRHVNGKWLDQTKIPADKSNYSSFTHLADEARKNIKGIVEELAAAENPTGDGKKIADFYGSFMDEAAAEAAGAGPLKAELDRIKKIRTKGQVAFELGRQGRFGLSPLVTLWVDQDAKSSTEYILYMQQAGLGMPDRDYYLKDDAKLVAARKAYLAYIEALLAKAGLPKPGASAKKILALETELAKAQWTRVESRNRDKTYNKMDPKALAKLAPSIAWAKFFEGSGMKADATVIVRQPSYVASLTKRMKRTRVSQWKLYLQWQVINGLAPMLSKEFVDLHFGFYGKVLSGTEENEARWKRAMSALDHALGEALGRTYVERHFKPEAKARMLELVTNLRKAFESGIESLEWMSPTTKVQAKAKLMKFVTKIGYPDEWRDYSDLEVKAGDLVGNVLRAREFEHARNLKKLGTSIDRGEWFMTPQTVNAYYNPPMNEIVFPAAILQPPFFNLEADDAVNYGAIGAVIGHEISHGFDDQGRKSDGDGNLRDWWTAEDAEHFEARAGRMVSQYDGFEALPGQNVQGKLTLGENIGDLGGLTIAYRAYNLSLNGTKAASIDGFSGEQRFFIGWAQVWRRKYRDAELQRRLLTDPHSPAKFRVLGIVSNMPEFYEAFSVKAGDKLFRPEAERVKIW